MKVLVIGGGGREHAIVKKLKESPKIRHIYAVPGNAGIAADADCRNIGVKEINNIVLYAIDNEIDYAVVGPDDALALGVVDALNRAGIPCFGPTAKAAEIESSKVFSKNLMKKYNIPTAAYEVFNSSAEALAYIESAALPIVVKADGLALGKGVVIAETREQAREAVTEIMDKKKFGKSGDRVVIEEFLRGPEVSVLAFTDGRTVVPMISAMDHKRVGNGDTGPNTGGMGVVAPNPYYTKEIADLCMEKIFIPTVDAMRAEGREFHGCLFFGLMLTERGPMVIEYNGRFGDPETQAVLPLLKTDLLTVMQATTDGTLGRLNVEFSEKHSCCVVMAAGGYPGKTTPGYTISFEGDVMDSVCVAGAKMSADGKRMLTSGGRVLGVCGMGDTLTAAIDDAYGKVARISFTGEFHRKDIGERALMAALGKK